MLYKFRTRIKSLDRDSKPDLTVWLTVAVATYQQQVAGRQTYRQQAVGYGGFAPLASGVSHTPRINYEVSRCL